MNKKNIKIKVGITLIVSLILFSSFQGVAVQPQEQKKTVQITVYNFKENTIRYQTVNADEFISFFNNMDINLEEEHFTQIMETKLNSLYQIGIITENEKHYLEKEFYALTEKASLLDVTSKGLFFDLLNIFNGFGFAIKGEQTRSFLNLPVMRFPFFNSNITAQFTMFNSFDGNGFIFTLGVNGFRFIYDYDMQEYEFPYFSPVKGWFIGYTGIILETTISDSIDEEYEGTYIIGFGMNVLTLWNNK